MLGANVDRFSLIGEPACAPYYSNVARSLWSRILVGAWGVWLTTALSGVAGPHMSHGAAGHLAHTHGHGPRAASSHLTHAVTAGTPGHAGHHEAQGTDQSSEIASTGDSDRAPVGFACLEQCCCGAPLAIVTRAVGLRTAAPGGVLLRRYAESVIAHFRWAHSQPFANGPPRSA